MKEKDSINLIKNSNRLYDFAVSCFSKKDPKVWVIEVHKCTHCGQVLTDPLDVIYMEKIGYCYHCEEGPSEIGRLSELMEFGGDR